MLHYPYLATTSASFLCHFKCQYTLSVSISKELKHEYFENKNNQFFLKTLFLENLKKSFMLILPSKMAFEANL